MKLISMTDFVLERSKLMYRLQKKVLIFTEEVVSYAEFLKQPLTLGMFVPVDEEGKELYLVPLKVFEGKFKDYKTVLETYVKAKEKILFEGFEVEVIGLGAFAIRKRGWIIMKCSNSIDAIWENDASFQTIEDLVNLDIELTPSALKQIGL